jgi:hypothetical protein
MAWARASDFRSLSQTKPGPSHGFQVRPSPHNITRPLPRPRPRPRPRPVSRPHHLPEIFPINRNKYLKKTAKNQEHCGSCVLTRLGGRSSVSCHWQHPKKAIMHVHSFAPASSMRRYRRDWRRQHPFPLPLTPLAPPQFFSISPSLPPRIRLLLAPDPVIIVGSCGERKPPAYVHVILERVLPSLSVTKTSAKTFSTSSS